jgi:hypothetical protein
MVHRYVTIADIVISPINPQSDTKSSPDPSWVRACALLTAYRVSLTPIQGRRPLAEMALIEAWGRKYRSKPILDVPRK